MNENVKPHKLATQVAAGTIACIFLLCTITPVATGYVVSEGGIIDPGTSRAYPVHIEEVDDVDRIFAVESNATINIHVLNATTMAAFLLDGTLPTPAVAQTTSFTETWNRSVLADKYDIEGFVNARGATVMSFHVVIENNNSVLTARVAVRLGYRTLERTMEDISIFVKFFAIVMFFATAVLLFKRWKEEIKLGNDIKGKVLRDFGIGYMFAGINFFLGEFRVYWEREIGVPPANLFRVNLNIPNFPIDYFDEYIFIILVFAALTFVFLGYTVEKNVRHRKIPFVTYNLIISALGSLGIFLFQELAFVFFLYFIGSLLLAIVQIAIIYGQVIAQNTGSIRRDATFVLLGIVVPATSFILRLFIPQLLENTDIGGGAIRALIDAGTIIGLWLFFRGNMIKR